MIMPVLFDEFDGAGIRRKRRTNTEHPLREDVG
jgi:hypothetical protein